jgi:hypothetical protein
MSLTELIAKEDAAIDRWAEQGERGVEGAAGNLKQAEDRQAELLHRREIRRQELERQKALTLQAVERITSIIVLPHPERDKPDIATLLSGSRLTPLRSSKRFPPADIERACPGVGREWIRKILADLREHGEVVSEGRGPGARWRYVAGEGEKNKGITTM